MIKSVPHSFKLILSKHRPNACSEKASKINHFDVLGKNIKKQLFFPVRAPSAAGCLETKQLELDCIPLSVCWFTSDLMLKVETPPICQLDR